MTVRWKPLLIMSGLFLVVAVVGVIAMALAPRSTDGVKRMARTDREARQFDKAEIRYKQVLQSEAKNASVHEEMADFYEEWAKNSPAEKQGDLRGKRIEHLVKAVKYDKSLKGPKRALLEEAMIQENGPDAVYWAKEVLNLEPDNLDAHYVLAAAGVESQSPDAVEVRKHLASLEKNDAPFARQAWIRAKLAQSAQDQKTLDEVFEKSAAANDAGLGPVERMALLRVTALEIQTRLELAPQARLIDRLIKQARDLNSLEGGPTARTLRVAGLLDYTQRILTQRSFKGSEAEKTALQAQIGLIETDLESIYRKGLTAPAQADLQAYLTYADHLRFRKQYAQCLEIVNEALRTPQATRPAATKAVLGLHAIAVEVALARVEDKEGRIASAAPHVKALIACSDPRYQGLGHLFQGSIELEQSGVAPSVGETTKPAAGTDGAEDRAKLRASALSHLSQAAERLTDVSEAQARYGVALLLSGEQNLGRQYLQAAIRLGDLDAQYQIWAAWAILQGGYPEDAEPIVSGLLKQVADGTQPASIAGTLHLLQGEILQAKNTPDDLNKAAEAFEQALRNGQSATPQIVLRLAQIDIQQKRYDKALHRIDQLRKQGTGGPAAEQLAVLTLEEQGKKSEARALILDARTRFPASSELAGLAAALLSKDQKHEDADRLLADFIGKNPDNETLVMMRAQLLSESLKRPEEAAKLLNQFADRSASSGPLVLLTMMEIEHGNLDSAAAVIARIRARWKDAATADVLEAQLALKNKNLVSAREHFAKALKKDPSNKIVQYWKAQLDSQSGNAGEATQALESIAHSKPIKEVETGVTLESAAQSALANLSLRSGNFDDAIRRFEELKRASQNGTLSREDRWQLITAYAAKGQWPVAKREIATILNDAKNPPTNDERVRGSNFYRQNKEEQAAQAQLDYVLKADPGHSAAAVTNAFFQNRAKQGDRAIAVLRKAIETTKGRSEKAPAVLYVMLAAIEYENAKPAEATARAVAVIDEGLAANPVGSEAAADSNDLVLAKYSVLSSGGDKKGAVAFMEGLAKSHPSDAVRRLLVKIYRDQRDFSAAERELQELFKAHPEDGTLAAAIVQVVSLEAAEAAARGDLDDEKKLNGSVEEMVREYKKKFPDNLTLLQAECDLAARHGDYTRAVDVTHEIDKLDKQTSLGPVLRARIFAAAGRRRESAQAYAEAVERRPREIDLRILLGNAKLQNGEFDEALLQAKHVLELDDDQQDAVLLQARALIGTGTTEMERQAAYRKASAILSAAIKADPKLIEASHLLAEVELRLQRRDAALAALREALKANPEDGEALAMLIQNLSLQSPKGGQAGAAGLAEAKQIAEETKARDQKGSMILAAAVGFHKAGRFELAEPLAAKAAAQLDSPASHLNYGDLLLSMAEASSQDADRARSYFVRAVEQYDAVLKVQPNSVEAVNNKAWILHSYLGENPKALELVEGLLKRARPGALPGEFYDTLGAIQEASGQKREAEESYQSGLKKTPDHPVLNFHFGRLVAGDRARSNLARTHLAKALESRDRLNPAMAREAEQLLRHIGDPTASNLN